METKFKPGDVVLIKEGVSYTSKKLAGQVAKVLTAYLQHCTVACGGEKYLLGVWNDEMELFTPDKVAGKEITYLGRDDRFQELLKAAKAGAEAEVILIRDFGDKVKYSDDTSIEESYSITYVQEAALPPAGEILIYPKAELSDLPSGRSVEIEGNRVSIYESEPIHARTFARDAKAILAELERCGLIKK